MYAYPSLFFALLLLHIAYMYVAGWMYNKSLYVYFWLQEYQREGNEMINKWRSDKKKD